MENKNQNNPKAKNHTTLNTKLALPPQRVWSLCLSLNSDKTDIDFIPLQFHVKCTSRTRKLRTPSYLRWFWNWIVVPHEQFCRQTEAEVLVERGMAQSHLPSSMGINLIWKLPLHEGDWAWTPSRRGIVLWHPALISRQVNKQSKGKQHASMLTPC